MKKVTKENIQFIQNYLKNSGVEYDDVLAEMTDYVASEIEMQLTQNNDQNFYEVFKHYMIKYKNELLENVGKFRKEAFKKVVVLLLNNLLNPIVIVSTFMMGLIFAFVPFSLAENMMVISLGIMIVEVLLFFILHWKIQIKKGRKYSCLVSLALIIGWFDQFFIIFCSKVSLEKNAFIFLLIFIILNSSFLISSFQLAKYYRKNYQLL